LYLVIVAELPEISAYLRRENDASSDRTTNIADCGERRMKNANESLHLGG
jgi:hypothetical protein